MATRKNLGGAPNYVHLALSRSNTTRQKRRPSEIEEEKIASLYIDIYVRYLLTHMYFQERERRRRKTREKTKRENTKKEKTKTEIEVKVKRGGWSEYGGGGRGG